MITQASVGFGIQGNEGNAASQAADLSVTRFKDVRRLIMTHGRILGYNNSYFIFFVSFVMTAANFMPLLFGIVSGFSGTHFLDSPWTGFLPFSSIVYTSLMWLFFNADISFREEEKWFAMSVPEIYGNKIETHFKYRY